METFINWKVHEKSKACHEKDSTEYGNLPSNEPWELMSGQIILKNQEQVKFTIHLII